MSIEPPEKTDPYRQVTVNVEGRTADALADEAIRLSAVFLREDPENLYACEIGNANVLRRSPYRRHLGEQAHPVWWGATIKVRLRPEIVKARREGDPESPRPRGRGHLYPV